MKIIFYSTAVMLALSAFALADIPRPEKTPRLSGKAKGIDTQMTIHLDSDAKQARLLIPRSQLKQLRAQLDDMDDGSDNTAAVTDSGRTQTIVSGMFLSLALVFGGIWFARFGKASARAGKSLVVLAVMAGIGSAGTLIYANIGPPSEARSITGKMFTQAVHMYGFGSGQIKLETKPDSEGGGVELIVPNPREEKPTP